MNTPICDFVKKYSESSVSRLHMPGHKGGRLIGFEELDITEIKGADALYEADGIIAESEKNAAKLFGSGVTLYSTEGSSQCVKAMLYLIKLACNGEKCVIAAARNSHKSFVYGCGLLGIDVKWLYGDNGFSLCKCNITPGTLKEFLRDASEKDEKISAVYVTSPDYLGGELDIKAFAEISHSFGVPLIVDNAHGAYLHFLESKRHPMDLGADMCCDSAHKTLPVLTGGAYLHINKKANEIFLRNAKRALELFGSTSPSYLILQSLDYANKYISENYEKKLEDCVKKVGSLKEKLMQNDWKTEKSDPLKLTVSSYGINLSDALRKNGIECEYEDPDFTVMMFTPENKDEDYLKIEHAMGKSFLTEERPELSLSPPERILTIREAIFAESEEVSVDNSIGRILSSPSVSCPPAVPILVSGEKINAQAVKLFKYYGITKIRVIKPHN